MNNLFLIPQAPTYSCIKRASTTPSVLQYNISYDEKIHDINFLDQNNQNCIERQKQGLTSQVVANMCCKVQCVTNI